mmetsp:Transcript_7698/g.27256  ORF Transcript_7698/g.27256 Transcript_7698/m.27256 type:complete len:260 (-) Transcript_7698:944-1723(-)
MWFSAAVDRPSVGLASPANVALASAEQGEVLSAVAFAHAHRTVRTRPDARVLLVTHAARRDRVPLVVVERVIERDVRPASLRRPRRLPASAPCAGARCAARGGTGRRARGRRGAGSHSDQVRLVGGGRCVAAEPCSVLDSTNPCAGEETQTAAARTNGGASGSRGETDAGERLRDSTVAPPLGADGPGTASRNDRHRRRRRLCRRFALAARPRRRRDALAPASPFFSQPCAPTKEKTRNLKTRSDARRDARGPASNGRA